MRCTTASWTCLAEIHMKTKTNKLRILLIGPGPSMLPIGGTMVSFQRLARDLAGRTDVEVTVINTSRGSLKKTYVSEILLGIRILWQLIRAMGSVDIVTFHASNRGAVQFAPFLHLICRLAHKPWALRWFGGSFDLYYSQRPYWQRKLIDRTALSADLCLFETQQLVRFFRKRCKHKIVWYPTSRSANDDPFPDLLHTKCKRFVFMGIVKPTKGIWEIISAGEHLDAAETIDVYGPLANGVRKRDFEGLQVVRYCGVLSYEEVIPTLRTYDALVLPTYYEGEGYPSVIIEAYAAGIPVIASKWRAIPEIVDETSGILIEPRDSQKLLSAMRCLIQDDSYYKKLQEGALQKRQLFSSEEWNTKFVRLCLTLTKPHMSPS